MRSVSLPVLGFVAASSALGCGDPSSLSRKYEGPPLANEAIVLLKSGQVSGLGRIEIDGQLKEVPDIALGSDPALSESHQAFFAMVRDQNIFQQVDPKTLSFVHKFVPYTDAELLETKLLCNKEVSGINPHDVTIDANGRLWVTRFERTTLAILESDGSFSGTVDLSSFADADGLPEMESVHVAGDRVYVAIERLDRCGGWLPSGPGLIVVIDVATRNVVGSIELGGTNPFGRFVPVPWDSSGKTVGVALPGYSLGIDDGDAAAIVDLEAGNVQGFGREKDLGGSIVEVALAAQDEAYAIVLGADDPQATPTSVVRIDPTTGDVVATLLDSRQSPSGGGYYHQGLAVVGEHLLVGSTAPDAVGVIVLDRQSGQKLGIIPPLKLPPIAIQSTP